MTDNCIKQTLKIPIFLRLFALLSLIYTRLFNGLFKVGGTSNQIEAVRCFRFCDIANNL